MNNKNIITKSGNVTYYVNREKKTVVAVIKCDVDVPHTIFNREVYKTPKILDIFANFLRVMKLV